MCFVCMNELKKETIVGYNVSRYFKVTKHNRIGMVLSLITHLYISRSCLFNMANKIIDEQMNKGRSCCVMCSHQQGYMYSQLYSRNRPANTTPHWPLLVQTLHHMLQLLWMCSWSCHTVYAHCHIAALLIYHRLEYICTDQCLLKLKNYNLWFDGVACLE